MSRVVAPMPSWWDCLRHVARYTGWFGALRMAATLPISAVLFAASPRSWERFRDENARRIAKDLEPVLKTDPSLFVKKTAASVAFYVVVAGQKRGMDFGVKLLDEFARVQQIAALYP